MQRDLLQNYLRVIQVTVWCMPVVLPAQVWGYRTTDRLVHRCRVVIQSQKEKRNKNRQSARPNGLVGVKVPQTQEMQMIGQGIGAVIEKWLMTTGYVLDMRTKDAGKFVIPNSIF